MDKKYFLKKAEENRPTLYYTDIKPIAEKTVFGKGDTFPLDLGNHYVGKFSFEMDIYEDFISAPVELTIRFGEDMREINDDFTVFTGNISKT